LTDANDVTHLLRAEPAAEFGRVNEINERCGDLPPFRNASTCCSPSLLHIWPAIGVTEATRPARRLPYGGFITQAGNVVS